MSYIADNWPVSLVIVGFWVLLASCSQGQFTMLQDHRDHATSLQIVHNIRAAVRIQHRIMYSSTLI